MLEPLVLNDAIEAKEGLIVDTKQGRVAFRHHRTPSHVGEGAEWSEGIFFLSARIWPSFTRLLTLFLRLDLLFLEPVTECVNTNLTIEFQIPTNGQTGITSDANLTLIDMGGFSSLIQEYPTMNVSTSQEDPQLQFRAYKAAWLVNVYSMLILNVTRPSPNAFGYLNSQPGKRFQLDQGFGGSLNSASSVTADTLFTSLVNPDDNAKSNYTSTFTNETVENGIYDNPFNITSANYTDISLLCQGAGGRDLANASNIFVQCGLVYGAARRADGIETLVFQPGDVYQRSVYACASTTRASIKTVNLKFNATEGDSLKALTVTNVTEKIYSDRDGPNPPPLWAIETVDFNLAEIQQLWGLIDESHKDAPNITAIRAPHLHLPGYGSLGPTPNIPGYQFIPGTTATGSALGAMYSSLTGLSSNAYDYTGTSNLALFQKWQSLSANETGIARMLNIIWADTAANLMTGTRGWGTGNTTNALGGHSPSKLSKRQDSEDDQRSVMVPVRLYEKKIRYHWVYGIPAFMALALFLGILAGSCCCMLFQRGGPKRTRYYLNHLSAGRLLAEQKYPGTVDRQADTKTWIKLAGRHPVDLQKDVGHGYGGATVSPGGVGGLGVAPAVAPTAGVSPYVGQHGGSYESKSGMGASATELSSLNPVDRPERGPNAQGYFRVQS